MPVRQPARTETPASVQHSVLRATDLTTLTRALVAIPSVSGQERQLADLVQRRLRTRAPHLAVHRVGNNVVARTRGDRAQRIVFAGHLDTVPEPSTDTGGKPFEPDGPGTSGNRVTGLGAVDMKGGLAVMLRLAEQASDAGHESTYVFYDKEEIGSRRSGMRQLFDEHRDLLHGDLAVVLEPTNGTIEAGCQGNLVVELEFLGSRAHTARPWRGVNAVHRAASSLARVAATVPPPVEVDGLVYRQALSVVGVTGGVQGNVVPDRCLVKVNYRHAPTLDSAAARALVSELAPEADSSRVLLSSPPALPALTHPLVARLRAGTARTVGPKLGWTDVGRFAAHGIPAVNFGPGDSELAHSPYEVVDRDALEACYQALLGLLRNSTGTDQSPERGQGIAR